MMDDPAFKRQMESMMADPNVAKAKDKVRDFISDDERLSTIYSQLKTGGAAGVPEAPVHDGKYNAQLGMNEMARAASDPRELAEAMEMMKDPEVQRQVQEMMKDPQFKAEMKRYTENPRFKQAMDTAAEKVQEISQDPVKMENIKAQMASLMNN